jgi:two-component system, LytTR family, response regulator
VSAPTPTPTRRIRALIVDDEPLSRRALRQLLSRHPDADIVGECRDAFEAETALRDTHPDVVFLDVRMPERSGLDVARARNEHGNEHGSAPLIVFVTAFEEFALPAFETEAIDYLTKPVTEERFDAAFRRVRERLDLMARAESLDASTSPAARYADRLVARVRDRDVIIPVTQIDYIAADDVYATVHARGTAFTIRSSLDALGRILDPSFFVRVHRSYIVQFDRVTAVRQLPGGHRALVLSTGASLPVSRRRRHEIDRMLGPHRPS